jgi:hypothetical protein
MSGTDEQLLREFEAERAIQRVMLEYARGIDEHDWERVRACFHEDAQIHYGTRYSGSRDEAVEWNAKLNPKLLRNSHYFGPPIIDLDLKRGVASCQTWCINVLQFPPDARGELRQGVSGYFDVKGNPKA